MTQAKPLADRCSAVQWPDWSCKHGHAFTAACLVPSEKYPPLCCREDFVFDSAKQVVRIGRVGRSAQS